MGMGMQDGGMGELTYPLGVKPDALSDPRSTGCWESSAENTRQFGDAVGRGRHWCVDDKVKTIRSARR